MTYCTLDDLKARYGERMLIDLTDRGAMATGVIDTTVVNRALTDTDAMIDGYLAVRYRLPLSAAPALVADVAQMIAIWKLHVAAPDPKIEEDYKTAIRTLEGLSRGNIRLTTVEGIEPAGMGGNGVRLTDRARPLTAENLKGYI